jgi:hypothetical protein
MQRIWVIGAVGNHRRLAVAHWETTALAIAKHASLQQVFIIAV